MASSRVLILTRLDPCLIRLIVTQWAMGAFAEFGQARPELFGSRVNEQDHLKSPGRVREEFGKVRSGFRQEFGWDFRLIRLLSLDLLHFLSRCFDEFHELVNAIVPDTNLEAQVETLVQIIREEREGTPAPTPSPAPPLSSSFSEQKDSPAPFPPLSRAFHAPTSGVRKGHKTIKGGGRQSSGRPSPAPPNSLRKEKHDVEVQKSLEARSHRIHP